MSEVMIKRGCELSQQLFKADSNKPWGMAKTLLKLIETHYTNENPFSIVRLGDGEGRILGYPDFFSDQVMKTDVLGYQYGKHVFPKLKKIYGSNFVSESINDLSKMLYKALDSADAIGLPSYIHFEKPLTDVNFKPRLANSVALSTVNSLLARGSSAQVYDFFIFKAFHKQGLFSSLLKDKPFVGVISHTDISALFKSRFGIDQVVHYPIPGHQSFMKSNKLHYPDVYGEVIDSIDVPFQGALFLVAAGYLGKMYCHEIKARGGIALDIGSVFDSWIGLGRTEAVRDESMRL